MKEKKEKIRCRSGIEQNDKKGLQRRDFWQCCPISEIFCKCSNALCASVKAGSEVAEKDLLSGSERRKRSMAALRWISLMNFCKLTMCHLSSSQTCKTSSEKHLVLLLTFHHFRKFGATRTSHSVTFR